MEKLFRFISSMMVNILYILSDPGEPRAKLLRKTGVSVGARCRILCGFNSFGSEPYLIKIGDHCEITSGVKFVTHDGSTWIFRERKDWKDDINRFGPICIKDNTFIGINSIILPNVEIGPNSIVAAGSVVTKNVPANTIVGGNPAKVISDTDVFFEKCEAEAIDGVNFDSCKNKNEILDFFNEK